MCVLLGGGCIATHPNGSTVLSCIAVRLLSARHRSAVYEVQLHEIMIKARNELFQLTLSYHPKTIERDLLKEEGVKHRLHAGQGGPYAVGAVLKAKGGAKAGVTF